VVNTLWFLDPLARAIDVGDSWALFRLLRREAALGLVQTCGKLRPLWTDRCTGNEKLSRLLPVGSSLLVSFRMASSNAINAVNVEGGGDKTWITVTIVVAAPMANARLSVNGESAGLLNQRRRTFPLSV